MTSDARVPAPTTGAAPAAPLSVAVAGSFEELAGIRDEWDALVAATNASVYFTYDHSRVWWTHYGGGRSLRIFVFRSEGALAAILPMFVERVWLGPVALRRGGLVGSDCTIVVMDPPVRAAVAREAADVVLRRLLSEMRCDVVRLGPLAGASTFPAAAIEAANGLGESAVVFRDADAGPYTMFHLPPTFDAYLASLSKGHRGNYKRSVKQMSEAHEVRNDVVSDPAAIEAEFPAFVRMHEIQWNAEGKLGHFRDWPRAEAYHRDLVRAHGARGRTHFLRLFVGGEVVAYQMCYAAGPMLHWFLTARALRPDLEKYSLGKMGLVDLIEHTIRAGCSRIEGGVGHYDYKVQLGGDEHRMRSIVVARRGSGVALRLALFLRLAHALDFLYYRVWFQRLAPKLPFPRRPLWNIWIRSRL